jgi:mannose-6-phosphate isomerase-like protein (cupin superfamily)
MKPQEILKSEGFAHIYEWHDEPDIKYPSHAHKGNVTLCIERGEVTFHFSDDTIHVVKAGERFDVPVGLEHTAVVGSDGCEYVVGEMIEGDS